MWAGNVVGFSEASDVISVDLSSQEGTDIQIARLATFSTISQCLKIAPKVAFNIASEASYVYVFEWTKVH